MSDAARIRTRLAGVLLLLVPAERAQSVDCEYLVYLHEQALTQCSGGITFAGAKYQPCDMVEMQAPAYRACTRQDLSCVEVSAPITALRQKGCVALSVTNSCGSPQRLYLQGTDLDHSAGAFDTYELTGEGAILSCCGTGEGCADFRVVHAEAFE